LTGQREISLSGRLKAIDHNKSYALRNQIVISNRQNTKCRAAREKE
jgi:hypothetical protein